MHDGSCASRLAGAGAAAAGLLGRPGDVTSGEGGGVSRDRMLVRPRRGTVHVIDVVREALQDIRPVVFLFDCEQARKDTRYSAGRDRRCRSSTSRNSAITPAQSAGRSSQPCRPAARSMIFPARARAFAVPGARRGMAAKLAGDTRSCSRTSWQPSSFHASVSSWRSTRSARSKSLGTSTSNQQSCIYAQFITWALNLPKAARSDPAPPLLWRHLRATRPDTP